MEVDRRYKMHFRLRAARGSMARLEMGRSGRGVRKHRTRIFKPPQMSIEMRGRAENSGDVSRRSSAIEIMKILPSYAHPSTRLLDARRLDARRLYVLCAMRMGELWIAGSVLVEKVERRESKMYKYS